MRGGEARSECDRVVLRCCSTVAPRNAPPSSLYNLHTRDSARWRQLQSPGPARTCPDLGVVVAAPHDDQVLEAAADEELAAVQEALVARPQELGPCPEDARIHTHTPYDEKC